MASYIAQQLLYNKDMVPAPDPETGVIHLVEAGFVYPGQTIELDDERAEILLAIGAIVLAPAVEPPPEIAVEPPPPMPNPPVEADTPARRRRRA